MTITDLFIYPVKSLGGIRVEAARITSRGLEHDRRWMVVRPDGGFVSQRTLPALSSVRTALVDDGIELAAGGRSLRLPLHPADDGERRMVRIWKDDVEAVHAHTAASEWLSEAAGDDVRLVWMPDDAVRAPDPAFSDRGDRVSFADGYPLLLTGSASLDELNRSLEHPVPMTRFRPNAVVETKMPWEEEAWRDISLGPARMHVAKPCSRCVVTTVPQFLDPADVDAAQDSTEPLRTLSRIHLVNGKAVFGVNLIPNEGGRIEVGDEVKVRRSVMGV